MQVSEQSWHLRYVRWWQPDLDARQHGVYVPRDLCSYFWKVVGMLTLPTFLGLAVLTLIVLGGFALYEAFRDHLWMTSFIVGTIPITITAVVLAIRSIVRWRSGRPARVKKPKRKKEPGLLRSYLSAKKRRVCPLIEVVE